MINWFGLTIGSSSPVEFFRHTRILPFDQSAVERFHALRKQYRGIGTNDLRIAVALDSSAILVSRNLSDFGPIAGLNVEDWSS